MSRKTFAVILMVLFVLTLTACTGQNISNTGTGKDKPVIVTTIFPVYDWVKNIVGDKADVVCLINSGTDLHNFQPTAEDIITIQNADAFVYIGGESDEWVENVLSAQDNADGPYCCNLSSYLEEVGMLHEEEPGLDDTEEEEGEEEEEEYDEHIWLSLSNAAFLVEKLSIELPKTLKEDSSYFTETSKAYISKIKALDDEMKEYVSKTKDLYFLFADRFPFLYFTKDYGISYAGAFKGCSAESEASFETVTKLARIIDEKDLSRIYVIEGGNTGIAESVISVANKKGVRIMAVNSMQSVTQEDIDNGASYLDIMEKNVSVFKEEP